MEILISNNHTKDRSHRVTVQIVKGRRVKTTYKAYNAVEVFSVEIITDTHLNKVFDLRDLGFIENSAAYLDNEKTREARAKKMEVAAVDALLAIF